MQAFTLATDLVIFKLRKGRCAPKKKKKNTQQKQCLYIYRCTYFYIKTRFYVSSPALNAVSLLPLCFFSSLLLSCTTCSYSASSSMHWLRLRVSGRRTFSSDFQLSVSWSTCGGPEGAKRRCHGEGKSDIERGGTKIKYDGGGGKGQGFLKMSTGGRGRWDRENCCGVKGTKTSDSQVWREGKSLGKRKGKRTGGCCHSDNTVDSGYF